MWLDPTIAISLCSTSYCDTTKIKKAPNTPTLEPSSSPFHKGGGLSLPPGKDEAGDGRSGAEILDTADAPAPRRVFGGRGRTPREHFLPRPPISRLSTAGARKPSGALSPARPAPPIVTGFGLWSARLALLRGRTMPPLHFSDEEKDLLLGACLLNPGARGVEG